jgi:hypothetical protein
LQADIGSINWNVSTPCAAWGYAEVRTKVPCAFLTGTRIPTGRVGLILQHHSSLPSNKGRFPSRGIRYLPCDHDRLLLLELRGATWPSIGGMENGSIVHEKTPPSRPLDQLPNGRIGSAPPQPTLSTDLHSSTQPSKREAIEQACELQDTTRLVSLATTTGGLVEDKFRRIACMWPHATSTSSN